LRYLKSYQLVFAKDLLASIGQSNIFNGDLPPTIATTDARAQGTRNDLMAKADANNGLLVLLNNASNVLREAHDPSIIRERIMFL
jgi:hypothetical protein